MKNDCVGGMRTTQNPAPNTGNRKQGTGCRKGQVWSMDLTAAIAVFSIILLLSVVLYNNLATRWNGYNGYMQMHTDALFAADALMTTPGIPGSWELLQNISNTTAFGLANGRNEISHYKIDKLVSSNATAYELIKTELGLGRYQLGINITDLEGDSSLYEFGRFSSGAEASVTIERLGMINNTPVRVNMEVWK